MYNMYDEEEDDETPTKEKVEENDKTREKMKLLKTKMENLTLTKKVIYLYFYILHYSVYHLISFNSVSYLLLLPANTRHWAYQIVYDSSVHW